MTHNFKVEFNERYRGILTLVRSLFEGFPQKFGPLYLMFLVQGKCMNLQKVTTHFK